MKKKVLIAVCALALVVVVAIGGTVAWLTDETGEVKNTFTYGDINIELVETTTTLDTDDNVNTNTYKMVPGNTITKDPKVTVKADSEDCYLFVKIAKSNNFDNFMTYDMDDGWTELEGVSGVYYQKVDATAVDTSFDVIKDNAVKVKDTVIKEDFNNLKVSGTPTLTFTAYAVQQSVTNNTTRTAAEAWDLVND